MWSDFIKSVLILLSVSFLVSFTFCNDWITASKVFVLTTFVQVVLNNAYKKFLILYAEKIKNERIREFSKQGMDLTCPCYLEKKMFIPIELNSVNSFNCIECHKDCVVQISAKTFNKTDIIDLDRADAALIEVYKKIQEKE